MDMQTLPQEFINTLENTGDLARIVEYNHKIITIPDIILHTQLMLHKPIKLMQIYICEELARHITKRNPRRKTPEYLVHQPQYFLVHDPPGDTFTQHCLVNRGKKTAGYRI